MACRRDRVLAVVVIPGLFVFAVRFGDIPIQAFAAAGAFQDAGQDMCMIWVIDLLPPVGICPPFLLGKVPIFLGDNRLVLSLVNRDFRLLHHDHVIPCSQLLFCSAPPVCDLAGINRIIQHILHKISGKARNGVVLAELLHITVTVQILCHTGNTIIGLNIAVIDYTDHFRFVLGNQ